MEEKFCLKWNDYEENTIKTFSKLQKEEDFYDVTLVSDDQKEVMAHNVALSSSSEYFKNILKMNKHAHPRAETEKGQVNGGPKTSSTELIRKSS